MVSSLNSILSGASNAMGAHKFVLEMASTNIENANTPGYTRRTVHLNSGPTAGYGVKVGGVMSYRSSPVFRSILGAQQSTGFHDGRSGILELVEPAFNDLDGTGISATLDEFFAAISSLASEPQSIEARHSVLNQVGALARTIKTAADSMVEAQEAAESESTKVVTEANVMLKEMAALNGQIQTLGDDAGELIDQRDQIATQLADKLGVQIVAQKDGTLSLFTSSGQPLVAGDIASSLELVGGGATDLGLVVRKADGSTLSNGKSPGGRLGGVFKTRDETIKKSREHLDNLAFSLAEEYNALHEGGVGLDGSTGNALFEPLDQVDDAARSLRLASGLAGNPEKIAAGSDAGLPGDDSVAQAMLGLSSATLDDGMTFYQKYDRAAVLVQTSLYDATAQRQTAGARLQQFEGQRDAYSGVSLQEEMMALSSAERAFQAVSRVVTTANELYDTMLRMV
jgi:flagellar hook-associated protein 1 FlgK